MSVPGKTFSIHDPDRLEALRKQLKLDPGRIRRVQAALLRSFLGADRALAAVPVEHRDAFATAVRQHELTLEERRDSQADGATKLLFRTADGHAVESVILRIQSGRSSLCVSSQTGCAGGCLFCATGRIKGWRDLSAAEILDQAVWAGELLAAEGRRLRNVVFMGMGEPLQNEAAVFAALDALRGKDGFHLSDRHLLVSTLGVPDAMRRLAARFPQVGLAVSLHSARQAIRAYLMPMARRWPLPELREACIAVNALQGRALMVEVLLLDGLTDTPADVEALLAWLSGLRAHVNLIPFNAIAADVAGELPLRGSDESRIQAILTQLKGAGFQATRRHSLGADIGAACGQLAVLPTSRTPS
ncbi:MAG: 23S rRNA (adenine(2503)-C(2))-methyltransferase RlmN [bacterium]